MEAATMARTVSFFAAVKRLRRRYARQGLQLKRARSAYDRAYLGEWYVIDVRRNFIAQQYVDIHQAAADEGVLSPGERVGAE